MRPKPSSDDQEQRGLLLEAQAETLKELRMKAGLSQERLASLAHISTRGYRDIEKAKKLANQLTLDKLLKALGLSLAEWSVAHAAAKERVERPRIRRKRKRFRWELATELAKHVFISYSWQDRRALSQLFRDRYTGPSRCPCCHQLIASC
jgi:transcriptional regulator with XRE-family HTH domain